MYKVILGIAGGVVIGAAITLFVLLDPSRPFSREAKACEYEINLIGSKARGFQYMEPEPGHCWDCRSDEGTMSDAALRVCGRKRSKEVAEK